MRRTLHCLLIGLLTVWIPLNSAAAGWWHHHRHAMPVGRGPLSGPPCGAPAPFPGWENAVVIDDRPLLAPQTVIWSEPVIGADSWVHAPIAVESIIDQQAVLSTDSDCPCDACDGDSSELILTTPPFTDDLPTAPVQPQEAEIQKPEIQEPTLAEEPTLIQEPTLAEEPTPLELSSAAEGTSLELPSEVPAASDEHTALEPTIFDDAPPVDTASEGEGFEGPAADDPQAFEAPQEPRKTKPRNLFDDIQKPAVTDESLLADPLDAPASDNAAEHKEEWLMEDDAGFGIPDRPGISDDMPSDEISDEEMPNDDVPSDDVPSDDMPSDDMPSDDMPSDEISDEEMPSDEVPSDDAGFTPEPATTADDAFGEPISEELMDTGIEGEPNSDDPQSEEDQTPAADDPFSSGAIHTPRESSRQWQDDTGLHATNGRLVEVGGGYVRILKTNGRLSTVRLTRLSAVDCEYVAGAALAARRTTATGTATAGL